MFSSIVDSVKAVANRFSAPVTGDEHADKAAINKVTGTADDAYGTARDKVCSIHLLGSCKVHHSPYGLQP